MEEFKPVFLEIRIKDKDKLESVFKVFKLSYSSSKIIDLSYDKIDSNYLVSFKIDAEHYYPLLEKLTLNNLHVMTTDKEDEEIISRAKGKLRKKDTKGFDGWDTVANYGKPVKNLPVKTLSEQGDYQELIKIINDLSIDNNRREEAKQYLHDAVKIAIQKYYSQAVNFPLESEKNIKELIEIGSNRFLSAIGEDKLVKNAMGMAFEAVLQNNNLINLLIDLANSKDIPLVFNLKALATFAKVVLEDKDKYRNNIKYANYYLNLRWIIKIYDKVKNELTPLEKSLLKQAVSLINRYRTKV